MARLAPTEDQLSFICWLNEWCLVRLAFQDTLAVHPNCVRDRKFLMDFLSATTKPCVTMRQIRGSGCSTIDDRRLFQGRRRVASAPTTSCDPPPKARHLPGRRVLYRKYRKWVYLCHKGVFVHGPLDIQLTAGGRRSRDRVEKEDWIALRNASGLYINDPPRLALTNMLSVHCTFLRDQEIKSGGTTRTLLAIPLLGPECYGADPPPV